jgi:hypothetical protein
MHDLLERAEIEILRINDALEALEGVRSMDNVVDMLNDRLILLRFECDEYRKLIEARDAEMIKELTAEYWKAVI